MRRTGAGPSCKAFCSNKKIVQSMSYAFRFTIAAAVVLVLALMGQWWLPWYALAAAALPAGALFRLGAGGSFAAGFLAGFLLWGGYAWYLDSRNGSLLSARMGELFGGVPGAALLAATALVGGLLAGLGALTGSLGRAALRLHG
jgi:hypothetical protein